MENAQSLATAFLELDAAYHAGLASLDALSYHSELLIEQMRIHLLPDTFSRAMNCAYVIEEINGVVLDEDRAPMPEELAEIEKRLVLLRHLIVGSNSGMGSLPQIGI